MTSKSFVADREMNFTPSFAAIRLASAASCGVQQERELFSAASSICKQRNTAVTSNPSLSSNAAATAESTPPLTATSTFFCISALCIQSNNRSRGDDPLMSGLFYNDFSLRGPVFEDFL